MSFAFSGKHKLREQITWNATMTNNNKLKQDIIEQFGTPCAVIDLDIVDKNIAHLQTLCDSAGIANRPHIKTHKSPVLARRQLSSGAIGITCQKLGEAEIMAKAGIKDILIATNILGAARSGRLTALQRRMSIRICADNPLSLDLYAAAGRDAERPVCVVIECDTGQKRTGVMTPNEAVALGIFPLAAMVNHSCRPNCTYFHNADTMLVRTLEKINAGEEICISYIGIYSTKEQRLKRLEDKYYFECKVRAVWPF